MDDEVEIGGSDACFLNIKYSKSCFLEATDCVHHASNRNFQRVIHFLNADQTNLFDRIFIASNYAISHEAKIPTVVAATLVIASSGGCITTSRTVFLTTLLSLLLTTSTEPAGSRNLTSGDVPTRGTETRRNRR